MKNLNYPDKSIYDSKIESYQDSIWLTISNQGG